MQEKLEHKKRLVKETQQQLSQLKKSLDEKHNQMLQNGGFFFCLLSVVLISSFDNPFENILFRF
jgi:hypothetical protein